ncbi:MAG: galactose mutarotase [Paludibacteraceae bacterium]|nr:galactose mutarotase [Paludibacteraceae bacterium]
MLYTLSNGRLQAEISTYGAKLTRLLVPNDQGEVKDIVLGFASEDEWRTKETYFNAIIGRCANRIKNGRFVLDGKSYQLPVNNGTNSLHGGLHGFNEKEWEVVDQTPSLEGRAGERLCLHYRSADGEEGYPGNLDIWVTYCLTDDNALSISYEAKTDAPTIVNFTNHAYFNLNGEDSPSVRNHLLQVLADAYTPFDDTACPTGEVLPVEGTPMDFRQPTLIGDRIDLPFFAPGRGIDNNWILQSPPSLEGRAGERFPQLAAVLQASGRTMQVLTTCPALQVYTGNYVEENIGKSATLYRPQNAVCLETQNVPDAINHPNFPSPVLRPGEEFRQQTIYRFI